MSSLQEVRTPQEGSKQCVRAVQQEDNMLQHEDYMLQHEDYMLQHEDNMLQHKDNMHKDNMHGVMEAKQESAGRGRGVR